MTTLWQVRGLSKSGSVTINSGYHADHLCAINDLKGNLGKSRPHSFSLIQVFSKTVNGVKYVDYVPYTSIRLDKKTLEELYITAQETLNK